MYKKSLREFDFSGALKALNNAQKAYPENAEVLALRGDHYVLIERHKKAKDDYDALLALDSMNVDAWTGLSAYYRIEGDLESAQSCAELANILAYDKRTVGKSKVALGEVFLASGKDSLALAKFMTGIEADSTNVAAIKKLAFLLTQQKRYDEANEYLLKAYFQDQYDLETLTNIAYTFNKLEFYYEALEYSNYATNLDPDHPVVLSNRAYAYLQLGMIDEAEEDIRRSLTNDVGNPLAHKYAGDIMVIKKDKSRACKSYKKAEKMGYEIATGESLESLLEANCK